MSVLPASVASDFSAVWRRAWRGVGSQLGLALRLCLRRPLFAVGVGGTIALGVAAALVTGVVAWRVWLAPLPIPDGDRIVRLYEIEPVEPGTTPSQADPEVRRRLFSDALAADFHEHAWETIDEIAFVMGRSAGLQETLDGETYTVSGYALPAEGFAMLGISDTTG